MIGRCVKEQTYLFLAGDVSLFIMFGNHGNDDAACVALFYKTREWNCFYAESRG